MAPDHMAFANALRDTLSAHGYTLRSQRIRTGIAHSTVKNWLEGVRPSYQAVLQFTRGLGLDPNEWLALAGYEPLGQTQAQDPQRLLGAGIERLSRDYGGPVTIQAFGGTDHLTAEQAAAVLLSAEHGILVDRRARGELTPEQAARLAVVEAELEVREPLNPGAA